MGSIAKATNANGLKPVAWSAVEPDYRAGIRSLKSIGPEFGVAPSAILKHVRKQGITRDLKARVHFEAQQRRVHANHRWLTHGNDRRRPIRVGTESTTDEPGTRDCMALESLL